MRRIAQTIFILGWVSFFTDISSEMILPILPLFLTQTLGAGPSIVGLIEGMAETTASLLKIVSGWISDRVGKRKLFVVIGYGISSSVKPLMAWAMSWTHVLAIRFTDRIGKGVRTAPRDAIIADASVAGHSGRSFGFHRSMDTAGAVVGSLIAFCILSLKTGTFRLVFIASAVPAFIAVLVLVLFLKEPVRKVPENVREVSHGFFGSEGDFYPYLVFIVLLTMSQVGYAFALLRAHGAGISLRMIPIIYLFYNVEYALFAMPVGTFSDRWGRKRVLALGIILNAFLALGMAFAKTAFSIFSIFFFYGIVSSIYETIPRALVSDIVVRAKRGRGFGFYHTVVGITALPAALLFGFLWEHVDMKAAFAFSAVFSLAAFIWVLIFIKK